MRSEARVVNGSSATIKRGSNPRERASRKAIKLKGGKMTQTELLFMREACILKINKMINEIVDNENKLASINKTNVEEPKKSKPKKESE